MAGAGGRAVRPAGGALLVVLGAFVAFGVGAGQALDEVPDQVEVLRAANHLLRAENKLLKRQLQEVPDEVDALRAENKLLKRQLEEACAPPSARLHDCPGGPGGPPPPLRRLPEATAGDGDGAGGGGGDAGGADGGCGDDDAALREKIMGSGLLPSAFASFVSCSSLSNFMLNPDTQDAKTIWAAIGLQEPPTCASSFKEICSQAGGDASICDDEVRMEDVCCASCRGAGLATADGAYRFGTKPWRDEAQAFVEVLEALRVEDWLPDGIRAIPKDLCLWENIACEESGYRFWIRVGTDSGAVLSPAVGKLKHLERLVLRGPIRGNIPPELGECTQLFELDIGLTRMTGTFPASLAQLSHLGVFMAHHSDFGGELDKHLFTSWSSITTVDISHNRFVGDLPILNFTSTPLLGRVVANQNKFSGLAGVVEPDPLSAFPGVSLQLVGNNISVFPEPLRWFRGLTMLDLSHNALSSIPPWGYYTHEQRFLEMGRKIEDRPGSEQFCFWKLWNSSHLAPPRWPDLRRVDLSSNPVSSSLQQFIVVFGNAPVLVELLCEHCLLHGTIEPTFDLGLRLTERGTPAASGRDCILDKAHESLMKLSVVDNPDIHGCDFVDAGVWKVTVFTFAYHVHTRCGQCPSRQRLPLDAPTPLQTAKDCECLPSFVPLYTNKTDGKDCGCADGDFLDQGKQMCIKCADSLDCGWKAEPEASRSAPSLKKGYWMSCLRGKEFSVAGLYSCFSLRTCVGGDVNATSCSATSLCANGRTGRACSACLPGHFGGPDGECKLCELTPEETRQAMAMLTILALPVLIVGMRVLGSRTPRASVTPPPADLPRVALPSAEATGAEVVAANSTDLQISSLAVKTKSTIGGLKGWKDRPEGLKMRVMFGQVFQYVQLLATFGAMSVPWDENSAKLFEVAGRSGINFVSMPQLGCLSREQSAEASLLAKWVIPIGVVVLMMLAALVSQLLSKCPSRKIQNLAIDRELLSTSIYMLWSSFLPGLMQNTLEIFTCVPHPNGELTVASYRDIDCLEGSWWFLAAGGGSAFIFYILLFFLVSFLALRQVAKSLAASGLENQGEFRFMIRCVRVSELDHSLRTALRDVIYNLIVAIFAGMGITQLLLSAGVFLYFAVGFYDRQPYEHASLNIIDVFCSISIATLMLLSATLVHSSSEDTFYGTRANAVFALSVVTVSVPVSIFIFELAALFPAVRGILPQRMRPLTSQRVQAKRASLMALERVDLWEYVAYFDAVEFRRFVKLVYGSDAHAFGDRSGHAAGGRRRLSRSGLGPRRSFEMVLGSAAEQFGSPAARMFLSARRGSRASTGSRDGGSSGRASSMAPCASLGADPEEEEGEEAMPPVEEAPPPKEEAATTNEDAAPPNEEVNDVGAEAMPPVEAASPSKEEAATTMEEAAPPNEEVQAAPGDNEDVRVESSPAGGRCQHSPVSEPHVNVRLSL